MFQAISISNFQRHKALSLDLGSSLLTVTGDTDCGKSSLLRSIRWACTNTPQGESFIKDGTDEASVSLMVDDHKIERIRSKTDNLYRLDGKEYRAFGANVPEDIARILNLGSINFQGQHDSVFWFSQSAGEVSRQLNSVVDLGIIDSSLLNIYSKVQGLRVRVNASRERLDGLRRKVAEAQRIEEADKAYKEVETLDKRRQELKGRCVAISEYVEGIALAEKTRHTAHTAAELAREVGLLGQTAGKAGDRARKLKESIETYQLYQKESQKPTFDTKEIETLLQEVSQKSRRVAELQASMMAAKEAYKRLLSISKECDDAEREFAAYTKNEACPICGKPL